MVNNHNRLFSQEYYSWCPPIDLDKLVNFRQYVWLPISSDEEIQNNVLDAIIDISGPTTKTISPGNISIYNLPGFGPEDDLALQDFYDISILTRDLITAKVDGEERGFTYIPGQTTITFDQSPAADAEVVISVYSDLENNAIGLPMANPIAFGGIKLSSGMRVRIINDKNSDFQNTLVFIVEGVS